MLSLKFGFRASIASIFLFASVMATTVLNPVLAYAAVTNATPTANVSFTFDDGLNSAITQAAPTLAKYGLTGTNYVTTGCIGMTTAPNTCRANTDATYMTWDQVKALQNTYGWEIGSHTVTHPYLATKDASDGQPKVLTAAQVTSELVNSKAALAAQGITANAFAAPYGDYNPKVLTQIAKYYSSNRGFADVNNNIWPNNGYLVNNFQVQEGVTVAQVKAKIDSAIANKYWLVLTMHDIKVAPSTNPDDYEYSTAELDQIAAYVKQKQTAGVLKSKNITASLTTGDTNLLANGSFNNGVANGWTTDAPLNISKDTATNGSYPDPTNSIKLNAGAVNRHLFSPKVAVNNSNTYLLKSFLNVQKRTAGEVGYYIDEYDANGKWISGQWKAAENSVFVEEINFSYTPSSAAVKQASWQIYVTANSSITAYFDNAQWYSLTNVVTPPQTNLMTNSTFDAGISGGWVTNSPTTIVADATNNGSPQNPVNSVKATATTVDRHLFSPLIAVDSTKSYSLSSYVNLKQITSGELGFYIDEYDVNGNWISGKYVGNVKTAGAGVNGISYTPSSASVKSASLQFIVMGNSGIQAYIDNVLWYQN